MRTGDKRTCRVTVRAFIKATGEYEDVTAWTRSPDALFAVHRALLTFDIKGPWVVSHRATGLKINLLAFTTREAALAAADRLAATGLFENVAFSAKRGVRFPGGLRKRAIAAIKELHAEAA